MNDDMMMMMKRFLTVKNIQNISYTKNQDTAIDA